MNPEQVFKELKRSSAYNPLVSEETKLRILCDGWEEISALVEKSDSSGISSQIFGDKPNPNPSDSFGFIAEALAANDPDLSHNNPRGERLAKIMLEAMRNGSHELIDFEKGRLHNPDFIWVEFKEAGAIVWGIGEVKSSGSAFVAGRDKMFLYESSVRKIVDAMNKSHKTNPRSRFARRKVVLDSPLKKFLIVPCGMDEKCFLLPDGWEVANLKFTYDELLFIAKKLWPDFRPKLHFKEFSAGKDRYNFLEWFLKWGEAKLRKIVPASVGLINFKKLFLFVCVFGKLPVVADIQMTVSAVSNESLKRLYSYPNNIMEECEWSDWEETFSKKFSAASGLVSDSEDLQAQIKIFLTNFRIFSAGLSKLCRSNKTMEEIIRRASTFNMMVFKV